MVPYHGGAFLPTELRYTSITYRRIRTKLWRASRVRLDDAVELMCVYRLLDENFRALCSVFQITDKRRVSQLRMLVEHPPLKIASEAAHSANLAAMDVETGLAALRALLDGGWKYGRPPEFIRRSLQSLRREFSIREIADQFGIKRERMKDWLVLRKPRRSKRGAAQAMLLVG